MVFVLTATLVIAYIFLTGIMYRQTVTTVEEEIHREADYISKAVQISGTEYLNQMDEVRANTRITWISAEGTVLYDSTEDEHTFENHKNRPEVKKAFAKGEGEDIRKSDTIGEETLALSVEKAAPAGYVKEWKINGEDVVLGVEKK